ncbi:MAG TPA: hypothetical protein VFS43_44770 [Polyangiaceae bacterium]|nr:hypothetical protein [Polyangiaceae bacterium]
MRHRFDRISKALLRDALAPGGTVTTELEVPAADAQAIDLWFEPAPGHAAERERAGLLGRMAEGPTMFEPFHDPPGLDEMRACLRKQLALDHGRVLAARKRGEARPPFPRLWALSTGRPASVLSGYALAPMAGWPRGFYEGGPAEAMGVVVLRELPRGRATLLLRLMGAGPVLRAALDELKRLPKDAWERAVALPALVAARMEMAHDPIDESEREYLMTTQSLYDEWAAAVREQGRREEREAAQRLYEQRAAALREQGRQEGREAAQRLYEQQAAAVREQGRQEGREAAQRLYEQRAAATREQGRQEGQQEAHRRAFTLLYEARFGALPAALREALGAMNDSATLERWLVLVGTRPEPEVAAAMRADRAAPAR